MVPVVEEVRWCVLFSKSTWYKRIIVIILINVNHRYFVDYWNGFLLNRVLKIDETKENYDYQDLHWKTQEDITKLYQQEDYIKLIQHFENVESFYICDNCYKV